MMLPLTLRHDDPRGNQQVARRPPIVVAIPDSRIRLARDCSIRRSRIDAHLRRPHRVPSRSR